MYAKKFFKFSCFLLFKLRIGGIAMTEMLKLLEKDARYTPAELASMLGKQEEASKGLNVKAFAHVMLQPWQLTKDNLIKPIAEAGDQKLNLAVGVSVSL